MILRGSVCVYIYIEIPPVFLGILRCLLNFLSIFRMDSNLKIRPDPKSDWMKIHRENGGTLGMVPPMINPIYTLYSGYLLGISLLKGSLVGLNS